MKLHGMLIAVRNIDISTSFYKEIFDLEIISDYGINKTFSCGLSLQQDFDRIAGFDKNKIVYGAHNGELYFEEDNLDGFAMKLMNYNVKYLNKMKIHPWGQRSILFYDPDDYLIEVGESMEHVARRFLMQGMSVEETSQITQFPFEYVKDLFENMNLEINK